MLLEKAALFRLNALFQEPISSYLPLFPLLYNVSGIGWLTAESCLFFFERAPLRLFISDFKVRQSSICIILWLQRAVTPKRGHSAILLKNQAIKSCKSLIALWRSVFFLDFLSLSAALSLSLSLSFPLSPSL